MQLRWKVQAGIMYLVLFLEQLVQQGVHAALWGLLLWQLSHSILRCISCGKKTRNKKKLRHVFTCELQLSNNILEQLANYSDMIRIFILNGFL